MKNFLKLAGGVDVIPLLTELQMHPELWNAHRARKDAPDSPHNAMSDIWVRYNDISKFPDGDLSKFNDEHFPVWYDSYHKLPSLRNIIFPLMHRVSATTLGGVLISKIPPKGIIEPHTDKGWHPNHYPLKLYVVLQGNNKCINNVGDESVVMQTGDVWYFNNLVEHSVVNNGDEDRITLIICLRTE